MHIRPFYVFQKYKVKKISTFFLKTQGKYTVITLVKIFMSMFNMSHFLVCLSLCLTTAATRAATVDMKAGAPTGEVNFKLIFFYTLPHVRLYSTHMY